MEKQKRLLEEIAFVTGLKLLAQSYEEIATIKMRQARDSVLVNRDFFKSLTEVFLNVKTSYRRKLLQEQQHRTFADLVHFTGVKKNGKEVLLFFSANNKLYGDIVPRIFSTFLADVRAHPDDAIAIVGEAGKDMFRATGVKRDYRYFAVPDALTSYEVLKPLVTFLTQYEKVKAFYGKFDNVLSQTVIGDYIGENALEPDKQPVPGEEAGKPVDFYFEPSVEKILQFFETQVFSLLLQQTIHETELARLASRIKAMEQAIEQTNTRLTFLGKASMRIKHDINSKKQIEQMTKIYFYKNK